MDGGGGGAAGGSWGGIGTDVPELSAELSAGGYGFSIAIIRSAAPVLFLSVRRVSRLV